MYAPDILDQLSGTEIAIIGMACRFPGAPDLGTYWQNLCNAVESTTFFEQETTPVSDGGGHFVAAAPILDDMDAFDAAFFGYNPLEAELLDPQQRLFLEEAWHALEHAGYASQSSSDLIGVFAGARTNTYVMGLATHTHLVEKYGAFEIGLGNDMAFLSSRLSYKLNLRGPSYSVHTACSTGLVAVHLACQSLLIDECRLALAGSVALDVSRSQGYTYTRDSIVSPDGHCRAFDERAQGTVFGSGLGVVVLKRLGDAVEDGDTIWAVIRGTATNNDGTVKASFTAPAVHGQSEVILDALAVADVSPESIGYIEAHGTGTALGDPIEMKALTQAFRTETRKVGFCALGSVKTNFGHLDAAAGMAGLIKTALCLKHRCIPPTLHFTKPNPELDLENSPFYVNTKLQEWTDSPRRAGVSSFGVGGTNAHVVLEEAPEMLPATNPAHLYVLPLAAKTKAVLDSMKQNLAVFLRQNPQTHTGSLAFSLQEGREPFSHRCALVGRDNEELLACLQEPGRVVSGTVLTENLPVTFMFPGNGSQHVGMARDLYANHAFFRETFDQCAALFETHVGRDLSNILNEDISSQPLARPGLAMPILFGVEYSLARTWQSMGIEPKAMIGHSVGEYVAATLAGVFSLDDAVAMVALRGKLMEELAPGAMLAVSLTAKQVQDHLQGKQLAIAAINGPAQLVVSGPVQEVAALEASLRGNNVDCRRLFVSTAYHSPMVDPLLQRFGQLVDTISLQEPRLPFVSCLSGDWATAQEVTDPHYWVRHLRETVLFSDAFFTLLAKGPQILLEVGPGTTLSQLAGLHTGNEVHPIVHSLPHASDPQSADKAFYAAFAELWCQGLKVSWAGVRGDQRVGRIPAPLYPFQKEKYWITPQAGGTAAQSTLAIGKNANTDHWYFEPTWQCAPLPPQDNADTKNCLVFIGEHGLGQALALRLRDAGHFVQTVGIVGQSSGADITLDPNAPETYETMVAHLVQEETPPQMVAHCWLVEGSREVSKGFDSVMQLGFHSLLNLARALDAHLPEQGVAIRIFTDHGQDVSGHQSLDPSHAILTGPVRVLPQEHEFLSLAWIDVAACNPHDLCRPQMLDKLVVECLSEGTDTLIALRGRNRWVQQYQPMSLPAPQATRMLRDGGVYLITGGLGGVGYLLGTYLAETTQATLVLTGRSALPPRQEWDRYLSEHPDTDDFVTKIKRVLALESEGARVVVAVVDVADETAMCALVDSVVGEFGCLNGVLHAAGITEGDSLYRGAITLGPEDSHAQFHPKVVGTQVLARALERVDTDFVMLFSSNAATLGGLGYAAYGAANAFMDAFATTWSQSRDVPWISVDWDPWPEETKHNQEASLSLDAYAMTLAECCAVFERIATTAPGGQLIVATGDLPARYTRWVTQMATTLPRQNENYARPSSAGELVLPSTATEERLRDLWQEVLGLDEIGIHDNFFGLGGHSLNATRLMTRLRQSMGMEIPIQEFFAEPTIAWMAQRVQQNDQARDAKDLEDQMALLAMVTSLSEDGLESELERFSEGQSEQA